MKLKQWLVTSGIIWLSVSILAPTLFAKCKGCGGSDVLCGPRSLLVVCQRLGVRASLAELTGLCSYDEKNGTSMLGLQSAAKAKGLQAVGMKIGLDELAAFKDSIIAHLWDNHFVVLEPGDADTIIVTDPPGEPKAVKKDDFKKSYSGFALLIAKDASLFPAPKDEGPDLRFDSYNWDFGSVNQGDLPTYSFKCRNVGSADLVISKVDTSCSDCVIPTDWTRTISPGGEGEIKVLVMTPNQQRGIAKQLYVTSNDPISPMIQLEVTGYIRPAQLLFSPRTVNFGTPRRTESISREVFIPSAPEDSVEVTSVTSDSQYVTAAVASSVDKNRPGHLITASLEPGAPIGEFKAKITILSDHPKQPKAELPISATIRGSIDLDRDMFFLGLVKKGKTSVSNVTISTVGKDPFAIGKIDNPLDCVTVEVKPKTEGKEYVLTATLKPDAPLGNIKGDITIHTNDPDQPEIKIPVYAYVEQ